MVCALALRVPYPGHIAPGGIADERGFYVRVTGHANPVRLHDHLDGFQARHGEAWTSPGTGRELLLTGGPRCEPLTRWGQPIRRCMFRPLLSGPLRVPLAATVPAEVRRVLTGAYIGAAGYVIGLDGVLVDQHGITDPLAARLELGVRGLRPGHEKLLPTEWVVARFAAAVPPEMDAGAVAAARRALGCAPLQALLRAVTDPMTPARFAANLRDAFALQRLRIPEDPWRAERALCG
jgi:arabinofuranosyltransferase